MSGEAFVKRYPGGFVDLPSQTTPIDSQFLNAVEAALVRLLGADPVDQGVQTWDVALGRFKTILLTNAQVAGGAGISRTKLDLGAGLVDADIAPGAAIAASKISGISVTAAPAGAMLMWGTTIPPTGWLLCDGTAVSRATQAGIFSQIGTAYGAGDGTTTFNLPDFRGRVPVGVGTHADVSTLGANDGAVLASRRPKHKHAATAGTLATGNDTPDHVHSIGLVQVAAYVAGSNFGTTGGTANSGGASTRHTHPVTGVPTVGPQTGAEPTDSVAYLAVNVVIKT